MSNRKKVVIGTACAFLCIVGVALFALLSGECSDTAWARKHILSKLTAEQAATLRPILTMSDQTIACTRFFIYIKNGKEVEVSFLPDEIHGMKFWSTDDNESAARLRER
jgi:hypothetical protein